MVDTGLWGRMLIVHFVRVLRPQPRLRPRDSKFENPVLILENLGWAISTGAERADVMFPESFKIGSKVGVSRLGRYVSTSIYSLQVILTLDS